MPNWPATGSRLVLTPEALARSMRETATGGSPLPSQSLTSHLPFAPTLTTGARMGSQRAGPRSKGPAPRTRGAGRTDSKVPVPRVLVLDHRRRRWASMPRRPRRDPSANRSAAAIHPSAPSWTNQQTGRITYERWPGTDESVLLRARSPRRCSKMRRAPRRRPRGRRCAPGSPRAGSSTPALEARRVGAGGAFPRPAAPVTREDSTIAPTKPAARRTEASPVEVDHGRSPVASGRAPR